VTYIHDLLMSLLSFSFCVLFKLLFLFILYFSVGLLLYEILCNVQRVSGAFSLHESVSFLIPVKCLQLTHFVLLCAISWQTSADGAQGTLTTVIDSRRQVRRGPFKNRH